MGIQKSINTRLIKLAIGKRYVYEIIEEEKADAVFKAKTSEVTKFFKDGLDELKRTIKK